MSLSYGSKISSPEPFPKAMERAYQVLLVVDRHHIKLEGDLLVLVEPPLKMYGITRERYISFTYSTVDQISEDTLTAHIGIRAAPLLLTRIVLDIDQCFFTEVKLPIEIQELETGSDHIRENLLNFEYKSLLFNILYDNYYYSDNPILLDDHEVDKYRVWWFKYQFITEIIDFEHLINTTMLELGPGGLKSQLLWVTWNRRRYAEDQEKEQKKLKLKQKKQKRISRIRRIALLPKSNMRVK